MRLLLHLHRDLGFYKSIDINYSYRCRVIDSLAIHCLGYIDPDADHRTTQRNQGKVDDERNTH